MTGGRRRIGATLRLRAGSHAYVPLIIVTQVAMLLAGAVVAAATGDDELLVVLTPAVVLLAVVALPQNEALQVILAAVTVHFLIIAIGWDTTERRFDILVTFASALAGFGGLGHRPWLSSSVASRTTNRPEHSGVPDAVDQLVDVAQTGHVVEGIEALRPVLRLRVTQAAMLSDRQQMIIHLALHGMTARDIGGRLQISDRTVESHLRRAYAKLGVHSRYELIQTLLEPAGTDLSSG